MTCNTISLVSRLIWKPFRWKFADMFEDVCSLHTCFSADSHHLLCCKTPCESSGRFFGPHGIYLPTYIYINFHRQQNISNSLQNSNSISNYSKQVFKHCASRNEMKLKNKPQINHNLQKQQLQKISCSITLIHCVHNMNNITCTFIPCHVVI